MCDPLTLTLAATGIAAVGKGYSAMLSSAQARGAEAQAQANAKQANLAAQDAIDRGNIQQEQNGRKYSQLMSQQRASMAANGIDISFGSASDLIGDTAQFSEEDSQAIARNAANEVRQDAGQGANYLAQARTDKNAASGALIKGALDVGSTILGGATQYSKIKAQGYGAQTNFGPSNAYGIRGSSGIY